MYMSACVVNCLVDKSSMVPSYGKGSFEGIKGFNLVQNKILSCSLSIVTCFCVLDTQGATKLSLRNLGTNYFCVET